MSGLYSALNISKNALLAFQTAVHVTGHNVANVDTEGYSRQKVVNAPYPPTPSPAGPTGSGVKVEQIKRYFDAFLEANLNLKRSDLGLLDAEETGLDLIQGIFNETNPLGLSSILEDFYTAWQGLSNNAEGLPERRVVIEKGRVLAETIASKHQALVDLEQNVRRKLNGVVKRINEIAKQIAELNRQITAAESGLHQANDLRDQRDKLISELSDLAQIRYFENSQGAYSVVLGRGYNLVDLDSYWQLEPAGSEVYWRGHSGEKIKLTSQEVNQGKLGGWLRIVEQISNDWNHEYVISTKNVFTLGGKIIKEDTTWDEIGIPLPSEIRFRGQNHFGEEVEGAYKITNKKGTVRDFLNEIEKAFDYNVSAYLNEDGQLIIKDNYRGGGKLNFEILSGPLQFGTFDDESANHRVKELNVTGKFQLFAEELIRAVNELHSSGVGLEFYQGTLRGVYQTDGKLKGLPFFQDLKRDGSFFLWLKEPTGHITPVKVDLSLPSSASIDDVADQINKALQNVGFDPENSLKAFYQDGRLVFEAKEGWSFAFSNDSAHVLLATGINVFFSGWDAGSIQINEQISERPEYLAAGRLDREAWRSDFPLTGPYRSVSKVEKPESIFFNDAPHKIFIRFFDEFGNQVKLEKDGYKTNELSINVEPQDSLADILNKLDSIEGLRAYIDSNGYINLSLDPNVNKPFSSFELGISEPPPPDSFLSFLREKGVWVPQYVASYGRQESTIWFTSSDLTDININEDITLNFKFFDAQGKETGKTSISISHGTTLKDLVSALNNLPELRAGFSKGDEGKLFVTLKNPPSGSVSFMLSVSGGDNDGEIDLSSGGTLNFEGVQDRQLFSGLEPILKPTQYISNFGDVDPKKLAFSGWIKLKFFDEQGHELANKNIANFGSPDITVTDNNSNGLIDLEDLVDAFNATNFVSAYLDNGSLIIKLNKQAPQGTAYFVIEGNNPEKTWGEITLLNKGDLSISKDDSMFRLNFEMGSIDNWLFDKEGLPLDTNPITENTDPFRLKLKTDKGIVQILEGYNSEKNAIYGLKAKIDDNGRLVVETSGLYQTGSFIVTDSFRKEAFPINEYPQEIESLAFQAKNDAWFFLSDENVSLDATFKAQDIILTYKDDNKNPLYRVVLDHTSAEIRYESYDKNSNSWTIEHTEVNPLTDSFSLESFLDVLNKLDYDQDGVSDFKALLERENPLVRQGRLKIFTNDLDLDQNSTSDWSRFSLGSNLDNGNGNLVSYLGRKVFFQRRGLSYNLQGFDILTGDNRNAINISALANQKKEILGQASISDYYSSIVGEVGIAAETVKNSKNFMQDLINQLQVMRDSISGVSIDEEMANLIKYQQAFAASAKILTVSDEMLDTLIAAKR